MQCLYTRILEAKVKRKKIIKKTLYILFFLFCVLFYMVLKNSFAKT